MPAWMRPLLAPPMVSWNRRHLTFCKKVAIPVIEQRIKSIQDGTAKEEASSPGDSLKNDALHWIIENAIASNDPEEMDRVKICRRLVRLNMFAIHTTSITITNTLLDLYSSPRAEEFADGLRDECYKVLEKHGGQWTNAAVNDLVRIDSTIKESIRASSLAMVGVMREVTKEDGIDLGDGIRLPKGVHVGAPNVAIHRDPTLYPNPDEFDAFLFANTRENADEKGQLLEKRNQAIVTTGESFIAFGHGRHARPGRFFASQEMKLMLAYIVMNFDVKLPGPRPWNMDIKASSTPSPNAKLLIRRR